MRIRQRVALGLAAVGLFVGSVYAVATSDAFVRRMVRSLLATTIRGPATVRDAHFSFLAGLEVEGLEVRDPADPLGRPAVRVERLVADYGLFLTGRGPRITDVRLEGTKLFVRRHADGTLSLATVLVPPPTSGPSPEPPPIHVVGAELEFEDPSVLRTGTASLRDVEAHVVPGADGSWRIELAGRSPDVGAVRVEAVIAESGDITARLDVPALRIDPGFTNRLALAGAEEAAVLACEGVLQLRAEASWREGRLPEFRGDVSTTDLRFTAHAHGAEPFPVRVAALRAQLAGGTLTIEEAALEALGARFGLHGTVSGLEFEGADATRLDLGATVDGLVVDPDVVAHLPERMQRVADAFTIRGRADATVRLRGRLRHPLVAVDARVSDAAVSFAGYPDATGTRHGFPWAVDRITGRVTIEESGRLAIEGGGFHGASRVDVVGDLTYDTGAEIPHVRITALDVPVDADMRAAFQDRASRVFDRWGVSGTAARIDVLVHRDPHVDGPNGVATDVSLTFDGRAEATTRLVPARLTELRGRVDIDYVPEGDHRVERVTLTDLCGTGDGWTARVQGTLTSRNGVSEDLLRVEVAADDVSGSLRDAVFAGGELDLATARRAFEALRPTGAADIAVDVRSDADRRADRVTVTLRGTSIRGWTDEIPLAAERLTGTVRADGDRIAFEGVAGRVLEAPFRLDGRLTIRPDGSVDPDLRVVAEDLPLGDPLREGLGRLAAPARGFWDVLRPYGEAGTEGARADAEVILRPGDSETPIELHLRRIRGPLLPQGLEFDHRDGELDFDGRTVVARLDAGIGGADVLVEEARLDVRTGRLEVRATTRGLQFPEDVETVLGPGAAQALADAMPGRNLHASDVHLLWDPAARELRIDGALALTPRTRRPAPDPGFAPEGTLDVRRLVMTFPEGADPTFRTEIASAAFRLDAGVAIEDFRGTAQIEGTVTKGGVHLTLGANGATFRAAGHLVEEADLTVRTTDGGTSVDVRGKYAGGDLRVEYGPGSRNVLFAGEVHVRGAQLERIVESDAAGASGSVDGDAYFRRTGGTDPMQGTVEVVIRDGDLVSVPVVSALLNLWPDAGRVTDAALRAEIQGPSLRVREIALRGPALRLSGDGGTVGFDGALDLIVRTSVGMPLPIVGVLLEKGQSALSAVRITGTLRNPRVAWAPFAGTSGGAAKREPQPIGDIEPFGAPVW